MTKYIGLFKRSKDHATPKRSQIVMSWQLFKGKYFIFLKLLLWNWSASQGHHFITTYSIHPFSIPAASAGEAGVDISITSQRLQPVFHFLSPTRTELCYRHPGDLHNFLKLILKGCFAFKQNNCLAPFCLS